MSIENGREIIENRKRVCVLLPLVFRGGFDYRVPSYMDVETGDYVRVPFGRKSLWGVVWGEGTGAIDEKKVRNIERLAAHLPRMSENMRAFIDWVSWYTLAPRGMVLKMVLSVPGAPEPPAIEARYRVNESATAKITPARARIIAYLSDGKARSAKEIILHAKVSAGIVRDWIKTGMLTEEKIEAQHATPLSFASLPAATPLSSEQYAAALLCRAKLGRGFSVTALDGVTGSGKTEVYFDMIAQCLRQGNQALVLLPEIALSVQWLSRFQARFGFAPHTWHSGVSPAKKRSAWREATEGSARVIVGARSALFLPFKQLALIIVDEEHDASYKQEEGVIYQARDMAVARGAREKIPVLLVSATPSLETEYNIENGRYARVHLPNRHNEAELPEICLLDMRAEKLARGQWISEKLRQALIGTFAEKRQSMLFMNRRGYAPLMLCRACGHRFLCPHCTASLVLHRSQSRVQCHHCGYGMPVPNQCPDCKHENCIIPYGPGVERVAEEVQALLPQARVALLTSDAAIMNKSGAHVPPGELIAAMMNGDIDVLVGTQMIAKGHHFAGLALVGVIDADMGLAGGDLRAGERTYQMLHQLSGRAGREKVKGRVLMQTYMPEHPVMQALAAGERDAFMQLEARMRADALMPPYGKLAAIIVEGKNDQETAAFARLLVKNEAQNTRHKSQGNSPLVLGPAPAPLFLLRGKYRYRILVKAEREFALQPWLAGWLFSQPVPASIKLKMDIDPYSFV